MWSWIKKRFKHPLSLKWKWGIIIFLAFSCVSLLSLTLINYFNQRHEATFLQLYYQENYHQIETYLEDELLESGEYSLEALTATLESLKPQEVIIRLFDEDNKLLYESEVFPMSSSYSEEKLVPLNYQGRKILLTNGSLYRGSSQAFKFQYIVNLSKWTYLEDEKDRFLLKIVIGLLLVLAGLSFYLSHRFLRPLTYVNNSLDLVEEENLSDIRMRKPSRSDEWSDLSLHVNRLLDKIDRYVANQKQFVEDVSHELRTPVAVVEGHLSLLRRWGKDDPEILEESIEASLQEIGRMKELVQEMLNLSRAEHVERDYKDEITEIFSTTRQVYNNFQMIHPEFKIFLDSDAEDHEEIYVRMYRNHFEQILIILLDNAVKYHRDRKEIHLSISTGINTVEVAVQDFGEGMSEEDKEKVFHRFYRVDKARSRSKGGNGLGLSIAQELLRAYRGDIRVESALGHGSIFYVELPILSDQRQIYKSKKLAEERRLTQKEH